jgi:hypothetical protein
VRVILLLPDPSGGIAVSNDLRLSPVSSSRLRSSRLIARRISRRALPGSGSIAGRQDHNQPF